MDSETGECLRDEETGEMPACAEINLETGESEINHTAPEIQQNTTRKFRIQNTTTRQEFIKANKNKTYISEVVPCFLFLFSATLFLNPVFVACLCILEGCLHVWSHKKNKISIKKGIYYQSPFHVFVCEFCGVCREEHSKKKITDIQDKRNYKFIKYSLEYSQGIVITTHSIKTKTHAHLDISTLDTLVRLKLFAEPYDKFDYSNAYKLWTENIIRGRNIG
ncbi:hypothetical protein FQA39_LY05759 [Lamprigera yunnana]|nr:hypothetical protein FQA39_LY05759 [Lamprigera yunnana]